jgi:hypothetical protein
MLCSHSKFISREEIVKRYIFAIALGCGLVVSAAAQCPVTIEKAVAGTNDSQTSVTYVNKGDKAVKDLVVGISAEGKEVVFLRSVNKTKAGKSGTVASENPKLKDKSLAVWVDNLTFFDGSTWKDSGSHECKGEAVVATSKKKESKSGASK